MKKTIFFVLTLTLIVIFCFSQSLDGKNKDRYLPLKIEPETFQSSIPDSKRENHFKLIRHIQELSSRCSSTLKTVTCDSPKQTGIQVIPGSVDIKPALDGSVYITGLCENLDVDQAVLILLGIEFFDGAESKGAGLGIAYGEKNIRVPTDDGEGTLCLWTIDKGDTGFFGAYTLTLDWVDYKPHYTYKIVFAYGTPEGGLLPYANTRLSLENLNYTEQNGQLKISARVKNSSTNYGCAYTAAGMVVFDPTNTKVIDGAGTMVGDTSSAGYSWAVYPGESKPVDFSFDYVASTADVGSDYRVVYLFYEGEINYAQDMSAPFGTFETPADNAAVSAFETPADNSSISGSIAVTGWVLDDIAMKNVKIYVEQGGGLLYVGDANFVEGARPDVEAAYPHYPNSDKAGWGYMMLTHFLPGGGNGTYTLHAIAEDRTGKTKTLGTKTIICDNANAVKPFGAIDTPTQGGVALGSNFVVWGWALTPQPESIPTNGSTINVWVDGVNLGHPKYNLPRSDIATLFPGYANSSGPAGYFVLDTTQYEDGVHTIQWTVTDSGGHTDGIGSRYFGITNESGIMGTTAAKVNTISFKEIVNIPVNRRDPIKIKRGFAKHGSDINPVIENNTAFIEIKRSERLEIHLNGSPMSEYRGYQVWENQLRQLPVGSTLDKSKGIFYWIPGPEFSGDFRMVFVETAPSGKMSRRNINIKIVPES